MNPSLNEIFDKIQTQIDLSKLCTCQLVSLAKSIEAIASNDKELILAYLYIESLIQGILFSHSNEEYWTYLNLIENRKITMIYHGTYEVQFKMMLKIPEVKRSFDNRKLIECLSDVAYESLSIWMENYRKQFGMEAVGRLSRAVMADQDMDRLFSDYEVLRVPVQTIFGNWR